MEKHSLLESRDQVNARIDDIKCRAKLHKAIMDFKLQLKNMGLSGAEGIAFPDLDLSCEESMMFAAFMDIGVKMSFAVMLADDEDLQVNFIMSLLDGSWVQESENPFNIEKAEAEKLLLPFAQKVREAAYNYWPLRIYEYEETNLSIFEKRLREYFSFVIEGWRMEGGEIYDFLMECSPEHGENDGENVGNYKVRMALLNEDREEVFVALGDLIDTRKFMDDSIFFLEMDELSQDHMDFAQGILEDLIKREDIIWSSVDEVFGARGDGDGSARCGLLIGGYEAAEGVNATACLDALIQSLSEIFDDCFNFHFESMLAEGINPLEDDDYEPLEGLIDQGVPNALFSVGINLIAARNPMHMADSALRYYQEEVEKRDEMDAFMEKMATQYLELSKAFRKSNDDLEGHAAKEGENPYRFRPYCWMNNLPYCHNDEEMARLGKHVNKVYGIPQ